MTAKDHPTKGDKDAQRHKEGIMPDNPTVTASAGAPMNVLMNFPVEVAIHNTTATGHLTQNGAKAILSALGITYVGPT